MNRKQTVLLTIGKHLLAVFLKFVLIIDAIPKLKAYVTAYSGHIITIDWYKNEQSRDIRCMPNKTKVKKLKLFKIVLY